MKMMFVVFFMNSLLSLAVAVHYCVQCIDPEAREAERVNHNERTIRLLYNHDWASCSTEEGRKTVVTSENGCFRARIYQGKVPKGYYYLAMGPISSLLTVRGEDLRWHKEEGKIFSRGYDKTLFEIEPCYRERCFEEHLVYWADRPIPATTPNVSSVPTTALVTEVQTTNSCGICFFLLVAGVISLITFVFVFIGGLFLARHLARRLGRRLEIGQKHVPQETNPFTGPALCPLLEGTTIV